MEIHLPLPFHGHPRQVRGTGSGVDAEISSPGGWRRLCFACGVAAALSF